jgi:hypothetical protein
VITIYRVQLDKEYVKQVQEATERTDNFGLEPTHGVFASREWWQHIRDGTLPVHHLRGTISSVQMGSMDDWPEFTMRDEQGKEFTWSRYANDPEFSGLYTVGRPIEVDYVVQRHRATCLGPGTCVRIPISIRIDETFGIHGRTKECKARTGPKT